MALKPMLVGRDTKLPDFLVLLSTLGGFVFFGMDGFGQASLSDNSNYPYE